MLAAGQFVGPLCILQLGALLGLLVLILKERKVLPVLLAGFYMGLAYTLPQMIYLRMPIIVTIILLLWLTVVLLGLCAGTAYCLPRHWLFGPLAVGGLWYMLDWINYTVVPIWGLAQSFGRSWTAYPFAIQFISITGITGVLFVIAALQSIAAWSIVHPETRKVSIVSAALILLVLLSINSIVWTEKTGGTLRVAAAGWLFDDKENNIDPQTNAGFDQLYEQPAKAAAAQGARVFNTGEMGFYLADHDRDAWMKRFSRIARENNLWLVSGYFDLEANANRVFFMNPDGEIVHEYTKTHKTPFEPGIPGTGDLQHVDIDGVTVGALICHDDNYSELTRRYGRLKADVVLCPTMDWRTVNTPHFQAIRARAIEGNYAIIRGAVGGTSAAISPRGTILNKIDHYQSGPGQLMSEMPIRQRVTLFARFGHWPSLAVAGMLVCVALRHRMQKL